MSHTIHDTFQTLTEEEFTAYANLLLDSYATSEQRKQAISYLQMVNSSDSVSLRTEREALDAKRVAQRKKQRSIETLLGAANFDFTKVPTLFQTQAALSSAQLDTLCSQDGSEIYVRNLARVGDLTISADGVLLDGQGSGGNARTETLTNTATMTGNLIISGNDTVIRGIDFTSSGEKAISFLSGAENVTFQNCKFTQGAGVGDTGKWFYGDFLGGNVTVTNCRVEGFRDVYLADFSSSSSFTMEGALNRVKIKRNYFKNNRGCIAARGKLGSPARLVQYSSNLFETDELASNFWDQIEASNAVLRVVVTDNTGVYPVGTDTQASQKFGFCQIWSADPKPFTVEYSGNKISNLRFGMKLALSNGYYSPATSDDDQKIDLSATLVAVTYAASFLYKANDNSTPSLLKWSPEGNGEYTPVNASNYPTPPTVVNPSGYTIVTI